MAPSTMSRPRGSRSRLSTDRPATKRPLDSVEVSGSVSNPLPSSDPQGSGSSELAARGAADVAGAPRRNATRRNSNARGYDHLPFLSPEQQEHGTAAAR